MLDWGQHRGTLKFDFGTVSAIFHTCVVVASYALTLRRIHTFFQRRQRIHPNVVPICGIACDCAVVKAYGRYCGTAGTYLTNDRDWEKAPLNQVL